MPPIIHLHAPFFGDDQKEKVPAEKQASLICIVPVVCRIKISRWCYQFLQSHFKRFATNIYILRHSPHTMWCRSITITSIADPDLKQETCSDHVFSDSKKSLGKVGTCYLYLDFNILGCSHVHLLLFLCVGSTHVSDHSKNCAGKEGKRFWRKKRWFYSGNHCNVFENTQGVLNKIVQIELRLRISGP